MNYGLDFEIINYPNYTLSKKKKNQVFRVKDMPLWKINNLLITIYFTMILINIKMCHNLNVMYNFITYYAAPRNTEIHSFSGLRYPLRSYNVF